MEGGETCVPTERHKQSREKRTLLQKGERGTDRTSPDWRKNAAAVGRGPAAGIRGELGNTEKPAACSFAIQMPYDHLSSPTPAERGESWGKSSTSPTPRSQNALTELSSSI